MRCAGALAALAASAASAQQPPQGAVSAVYDLVERILPGQKDSFQFSFQSSCPGVTPGTACWTIAAEAGKVTITGTGANELTTGLGIYLRKHCNMTIGWPRGGGSNIFVPKQWPEVSPAVSGRRNVPWSYIMNVCTHSYSLVWYSWEDWTQFIDWMALSGINNYLAMTGQEEVQYKVFEHFGLNDTEIRHWFNGPALLTWSRGQNEYGSNIAGPLPRSWMKGQWDLQRQILARTRSLGMVGQLPGYQGNAPAALKYKRGDKNMTDNKKGTAWLDSLDPLFAEMADYWMKTMTADFGTDHWYQLDGYFNGATAPWLAGEEGEGGEAPSRPTSPATGLPPCQFSGEMKGKYIGGCEQGCKSFGTLDAAEAACQADSGCGGVTQSGGGYQLRSGNSAAASPSGENSWLVTNAGACRPQASPDPTWYRRGAQAYTGLNRTDPDAIWSFQGWAFVGWKTRQQESSLWGFIESAPKGKFSVIDMSTNGDGEWKKFNNYAYFGAKYIWTTLHDFGGTDAMKGDLSHINEIPYAAMQPEQDTNIWGTGFTPEGIDQNPVYYEFMAEQNWRPRRVADIPAYTIDWAHRRYGLSHPDASVTAAWGGLARSAYTQDLSVQDGTGVPHLPGNEAWSFKGSQPTSTMCDVWKAWGSLLAAAPAVDAGLEPFRYDLVNLGREVLAQLSTPLSKNFSAAYGAKTLDAALLNRTGALYAGLLGDLDELVATDTAFQLGPWIEMARRFAGDSTDCAATAVPEITDCAHFYEWNARVQLTTWNPTTKGAAKIPGGPNDYASKHWSGLIRDYYQKRAQLVLQQALSDAAAGKPLDHAAVDRVKAQLAYDWTTAQNKYPTTAVGDAVSVSQKMHDAYQKYFAAC